jgi:glycosyltransferase involved in cell wall biosynthesis
MGKTTSVPFPFLSIVVPAFNEEATLGAVIERLLQVEAVREIVVVDDGSQDRTFAVALEMARRHSRVHVLRHLQNAGKTAALRTGFASTTGELVIVQDADLEYDPRQIEEVIRPIMAGVADVVYGSRFLRQDREPARYRYHELANQSLTFFSNLLTRMKITDVETGFKAFRGEIIRSMVLTSGGFGFEIEATAKIAKLRCGISEVPVSYDARSYAEGKKIGVRDGLAALWYIVRYNWCTSLRSSYRTGDLPDCSGVRHESPNATEALGPARVA